MGATTGIQWTSMTYNPWHGCHKVSPGCRFCYMYQDKKRYGQDPDIVVRSKDATFRAPLKWQEQVDKGKRVGNERLVFTCSWSDFFIEEADPWREEVWEIIRKTPGLIYQILSKRPERIRDHLPPDWGNGWPHVWLGVSTENQAWFEKRWSILRTIPAAVRFLSYEPALGPLSLEGCRKEQLWPDQVLCGGESGPHARGCDIAWLRSLKDQCAAADVACFIKQLGAHAYQAPQHAGGTGFLLPLTDRKGGDIAEFPPDLQVRQMPKVRHA